MLSSDAACSGRGDMSGEIMLAIRAARLFDGVGPDLVERPVVLVDEGSIIAVESGAVPAGAEVVDLGEATVLPGLIDAHVHLTLDASGDPVGHLAGANDDTVLHRMRANARTCLMAGITTVRDLGDRDYLSLRLRDETAADPAAGPHLLAAGPPITPAGGHCWFLGGQADGVAALRATVRDHAERGVDVIKIMASGGDLTPTTRSHEAQYSVEELRAAVNEAHRHGLPVTAHAHAATGIANVVAAGVDMIEHCTFLTADSAHADADVIAAIADRGIVVSATLGFLPGAPHPPQIFARLMARLPAILHAFEQVRQSGATIVCSSDAGIGLAKPHDVLGYGVADMITIGGFTHVQALRAVTSVAAQACRIGARKGRIAPGFDADLLAVHGNPLTDIAALRAVRAVFRAGRRVR
jgi:imidazolonepropionase-like amidohydrolase